MAEVKVYNLDGTEKETLKLSDVIFKASINENVIKDVLTSYLSNQRKSYAHTKTRADVRGGGKKPWKQKGTGRARHGSIRSPLWVGGGVTFGPTKDRNYKVKINKKLKDRAMSMLLTDKLVNNNLIVVDSLKFEVPKTKTLVSIIKNLLSKLGKEMRGMGLVVSAKDDNLKLSSRNVVHLDYAVVGDINPLSVVNSEYLVIDSKSLKGLEKRILKYKK